MRRATVILAIAAAMPSCQGSDSSDQGVTASRFAGGWDSDAPQGAPVMLLRDDLEGTLGEVEFVGGVQTYGINYEVEGELHRGNGELSLSLTCAEARLVSNTARAPAADGETPWTPLDCAGWELELSCALAGDCESNGCNLVCDVIYFGDGYATMAMPLSDVEDQFAIWNRV